MTTRERRREAAPPPSAGPQTMWLCPACLELVRFGWEPELVRDAPAGDDFKTLHCQLCRPKSKALAAIGKYTLRSRRQAGGREAAGW